MKILKKIGFLSLLLPLIIMMAVPKTSMAAQATVNLGTTSGFAVLAGSTITNTGTTTINGSAGGNVGLFPGTAFTGQASVFVSGAVYLADTVASVAMDDLVTAYNDADGRLPVTRIPTELGETTLTPGTYDSADGTFQITGTLTLDAQGDPDGVFVFKTASTLITASGSNVNLINSARFCRTFWKVGSSATLGSNSHFVGHIFALTSITANTGATVQGQLLARNGAVTLDNNTITNGICEIIPTPTPTSTPTPTPTSTPTPTPTSTPTPTPTSTPTTAPTSTPATALTSTPAPTTTSTPASAPILLSASPGDVITTVTGGQLPDTATPWYELLVAGITLMLIGTVGWWLTRKAYV